MSLSIASLIHTKGWGDFDPPVLPPVPLEGFVTHFAMEIVGSILTLLIVGHYHRRGDLHPVYRVIKTSRPLRWTLLIIAALVTSYLSVYIVG